MTPSCLWLPRDGTKDIFHHHAQLLKNKTSTWKGLAPWLMRQQEQGSQLGQGPLTIHSCHLPLYTHTTTFYSFICVCMFVLAEVSGQLPGLSFVFPLCGFERAKSSLQAWQPALLPTGWLRQLHFPYCAVPAPKQPPTVVLPFQVDFCLHRDLLSWMVNCEVSPSFTLETLMSFSKILFIHMA